MGGVVGLLGASFTALVGAILLMRFMRRWADRRQPAPRQPTFDQAELRGMLAAGRITPAEFERLQALVLTQQAAAAATESPPRGPRGFEPLLPRDPATRAAENPAAGPIESPRPPR
jgi:hypothetical protein